jgi:hypothetical protein
VGSLGTEKNLLNYAGLERRRAYWKLSTPPYPPPTAIQTSILRARESDTVGVEILPWDSLPSVAFETLSGQREQHPSITEGHHGCSQQEASGLF